jgi:hypothetical protein
MRAFFVLLVEKIADEKALCPPNNRKCYAYFRVTKFLHMSIRLLYICNEKVLDIYQTVGIHTGRYSWRQRNGSLMNLRAAKHFYITFATL